MKKKFIYFVLFFVISLLFTYIIFGLSNDIKEEQLNAEKKLVSTTYNTIIGSYKVHANIVFYNILNTVHIKSILENVNEDSQKEKDKIRKELYEKLVYMYENMYDFELKQLHFHLKNNESFLRFHRPSRYGDNLTGVRGTVEYVNRFKIPIHGFEEGRIYNGYRFVYPLKHNEKHLGSVETSVSMATIINEFRKEINEDVDFVIRKDVVNEKVFDNEKSNYIQCKVNKDFYHEKGIRKDNDDRIHRVMEKFNQQSSEDLNKLMKKGKIFNSFINLDDIYYIATYLPIKNEITDKTVAYVIVLREHNSIEDILNEYVLFWILLIVLSAIIIYFMYKMDNTKTYLQRKDVILDEVQKIGRLGYWEIDLLEDKLYWSDEIYTIFGIDKDEMLLNPKTYLDYVHNDDRQRVDEAYKNSIKFKTPYHVEYRIVNSQGDIKYVESECSHTFDEYGKVLQSLGTMRDITNIKSYQIKIEESKKQFESLVSHIPDIVYRCDIDVDFTMLYLNDSVKDITGYSAKELLSNRTISFADLIHEDDLKDVHHEITDALKFDKNNLVLEYRVISKSGSIKWVTDRLEIVDKDGYKYIEGVISDITTQKVAYDKLYKFIDTQDNIVILTDGHKIEFANKKFSDFLGYKSLDQFLEEYTCICDKFIENDKFFHLGKVADDKNWIEVIQTLPHSQRIVSILSKDYKMHAFSVSINNFEEGIYIITFTDISQTVLNQLKLEEKTVHDKLTNAYNREYFELNFENIYKNFTQDQHYLAIAVIDIDHFKSVNDNYGHNVGDIVLKELVKEINRFSRADDILIRWGGEEFIMLLKVESKDGLFRASEHLRKVIESHEFSQIKNVTCSIGGTIYKEDEDVTKAIHRADGALYKAKEEGRNQVIVV